jgi:tetratricopeptide (TPR) repeat protein
MKKLVVFGVLTAFVLSAGVALAQEKQDALYWYKKGLDSISFTEQVACYTKAIEMAPNWAYAYNNRGVAYFNLAEWDKSKADFDKALQLQPGYKLALANRAGSNFNKAGAAMEAWEGSYRDRLAAGF